MKSAKQIDAKTITVEEAKRSITTVARRKSRPFYYGFMSWGGRRDLNPRHSEPQSDALPAELLPPAIDKTQFTLVLARRKQGAMGQSHQILWPARGGIKA